MPATKKTVKKKSTVKAIKKDNEVTLVKLMHLFFAFGWFLTPMGAILVPLIIWLVKRDDSPMIDQQGKEILNFALNIIIAISASIILAVTIVGVVLSIIIWVILIITAVVGFILAIINAITINRKNYKDIGYPCFIRVL